MTAPPVFEILWGDIVIGTTLFELGDPPMGVAFGAFHANASYRAEQLIDMDRLSARFAGQEIPSTGGVKILDVSDTCQDLGPRFTQWQSPLVEKVVNGIGFVEGEVELGFSCLSARLRLDQGRADPSLTGACHPSSPKLRHIGLQGGNSYRGRARKRSMTECPRLNCLNNCAKAIRANIVIGMLEVRGRDTPE